MKSKKALGVVIATSLFLVVAIVATIGFQMWFTDYSSKNLVKIETNSETVNKFKVETIINNKLYISSGYETYINQFKIYDENNSVLCEINLNEAGNFNNTRLLMTFNENTLNSTHIIDLSSFQINASVIGTLSNNTNGISGNSIEFDGNYSNAIYNTNDAHLNFTDAEFTISMWFYPKTLYSSSYSNYLIYRGDSAAAVYNYAIYVYNETNIAFTKRNTTQSIPTYLSATPNVMNKWNFLTFSYDGYNASLYLNGVHINTFSAPYLEDNSNSNFHLGRSGYVLAPNSSFNGSMDEVAIYSKALTPSEVNSLYKARKALFYEQIIPNGIKELDISSCNITEGETYEVVAFTPTSSIQQKVVAK